MTDYSAWFWTIGVGVPLWIIVLVLLWKHAQTSALLRFILCFLIAGIVTPIGTSNGHSSGYVFSVFSLLAGGHREEFLWGMKIVGMLILPIALVLFGAWCGVLVVKNGNRRTNAVKDQ